MKGAVIAFLVLGACGSKVFVPIAAPCIPAEFPAQGAYPDTDHALLTAPDAVERYRLLALGREERVARLALLEPTIAACKGD